MVGSPWDASTGLIFFPGNDSRPIPDENYWFKIHNSLFGDASRTIIQGRYGQGLIPSVVLIPSKGSIAGAPEVNFLAAKGSGLCL